MIRTTLLLLSALSFASASASTNIKLKVIKTETISKTLYVKLNSEVVLDFAELSSFTNDVVCGNQDSYFNDKTDTVILSFSANDKNYFQHTIMSPSVCSAKNKKIKV